ncbi:hypothetical protein WA026_012737 [Henosepilachna vigintioctopunctata]|uniref:Uncharacterized protein n=1 Tax=Henosepilachna vigintioctopunctata TaxID=420089 RepID=A0AAW1U0K6_9CUCU
MNEETFFNADNKQKTTWQIIKTETGKSNKTQVRRSIPCDKLNTSFVNTGSEIIKKKENTSLNPHSYRKRINVRQPHFFHFRAVLENEVLCYINRMKSKTLMDLFHQYVFG